MIRIILTTHSAAAAAAAAVRKWRWAIERKASCQLEHCHDTSEEFFYGFSQRLDVNAERATNPAHNLIPTFFSLAISDQA
jgi:hypothetical protein